MARTGPLKLAVAALVGAGMFALGSIASGATKRAEAEKVVLMEPCRVMDTRDSEPETSPVGPAGPNGSSAFLVGIVSWGPDREPGGPCPIPIEAVGVKLNVTAIRTTESGYLSLAPYSLTEAQDAGGVQPGVNDTSILNWKGEQQEVANSIDIALSDDPFNYRGQFAHVLQGWWSAGSGHVVVDVFGYYMP